MAAGIAKKPVLKCATNTFRRQTIRGQAYDISCRRKSIRLLYPGRIVRSPEFERSVEQTASGWLVCANDNNVMQNRRSIVLQPRFRQVSPQCGERVGELCPSFRNRLLEIEHRHNIGKGLGRGFDAAAFDDREVTLSRDVFVRVVSSDGPA